MPRLVACPDKLRGTATAARAALAMAAGARQEGWEVDAVPLSDGGEGFLDCFLDRGRVRTASVQDALGRPVQAPWLLLDGGRTAVVETARAIGLQQVGGAEGNDPLEASSAGAGQLIAAAVAAGARRVLVGLGGSATTDGGLGAIAALGGGSRLAGVEVVVACDVTTPFTEAARRFAPQKGASAAQVALLERRLQRLVEQHERIGGVDVTSLPGAGAAGGLAGGLAAMGASLVPGFEVVAEAVDLSELLDGADLVVTGEGYLDAESFEGKVVGGVLGMCRSMGVRCAAVVGDADPDLELPAGLEVVSLVQRHGRERAEDDVPGCLGEEVARLCAGG